MLLWSCWDLLLVHDNVPGCIIFIIIFTIKYVCKSAYFVRTSLHVKVTSINSQYVPSQQFKKIFLICLYVSFLMLICFKARVNETILKSSILSSTDFLVFWAKILNTYFAIEINFSGSWLLFKCYKSVPGICDES